MSGRVLLGGRDSVPLRGNLVILHRVTRESAGPIDSVLTDAAGRYRMQLPRPRATADSGAGAAYVVSTLHDSLAYFSLPLNVQGRTAVHVEDLVVYPATKGMPPIQLARRLVTIGLPGTDGTREVLEILELQNSGASTRITDDSLVPTWSGAIPPSAIQFQAGQGDISPEAMKRVGDRVVVLGAIPPGQVKQLSYGYMLPAGVGRLPIPIDQPTQDVNLLIEDTVAAVDAPGVASLGVQQIEQRRFAAYRAGPLAPGDRVTIGLPAGPFRPQMLVPYVVGLLGVGMLTALVWALRRKPLASGPATP
ncbi:MAG TPA: hypothetical protein VGQ18_15610 [Gemmatimonadales bacterium]|nr:hypothetical protein [Gemmatimonadales bacterium]